MTDHVSPDIRNYTVGKGKVYFKGVDESDFRAVGNCPTFEFTPEVEKLEHFSSMEGVKVRDRTVIISKKGTLKIVTDEFTMVNLALAVLGDITTPGGVETIEIFAHNSISGEIKFIGTNEVGPRRVWHFLKVDFIPGQSVSPISDEWGLIELSGEVSASGGSFGTISAIGDEDSETSEPTP